VFAEVHDVWTGGIITCSFRSHCMITADVTETRYEQLNQQWWHVNLLLLMLETTEPGINQLFVAAFCSYSDISITVMFNKSVNFYQVCS
jgi:hypothetical protein